MEGRAANFKNRGGHTAHAQALKRRRGGSAPASARWLKAQRQDLLGTAAQVESGRGDESHDWQVRVSSWEFFKNGAGKRRSLFPTRHHHPSPLTTLPQRPSLPPPAHVPALFMCGWHLLPVRLAGTWTQRARLIRQLTSLVVISTAWRMWSHLHLAPVSQPGP